VQSIIYNYYLSNEGKAAKNFSDLWTVFGNVDYINSNSLTSIYTFAAQVQQQLPDHANLIEDLLTSQNILFTDEFGAGESNSGGYSATLPVYKTVSPNSSAVNVCSSNRFGAANKLGVSQFLTMTISAGNYRVKAIKVSGDSGNADPDIYLYKQGVLQGFADGSTVNSESLTVSLSAGVYIIEVLDAKNLNEGVGTLSRCFDVTVDAL